MKKLLVLIITAVCILSSFAFCDAAHITDNDAQHCDSICNFNCCSIALPQIISIITPAITTFNISSLSYVPHQELFVSGIERPPNF